MTTCSTCTPRWTSKDPAITAEPAKWNRSAMPFNLIYAPGRSDPVILPDLLTPARSWKHSQASP